MERTTQFVKLTAGSIVNLHQIVQLTPQGHLQLTGGTVLTLPPQDVSTLEAALLPPDLVRQDLLLPGDLILEYYPKAGQMLPVRTLCHSDEEAAAAPAGATSKAPDGEPPSPDGSPATAAPPDSAH